MKKPSRLRALIISLSLVLALSMVVTAAAQAEWMEVSGYSGHVINYIFLNESGYSAGTLWFEIPGMSYSATVAFSVPTRFAPGVRVHKIRFRFAATNADSLVTSVDVYNGNSKVTTIEGPWHTTGGEDIFKTVTLTLPAPRSFSSGLGLEIHVMNPYNAGVFRFAMAGADFY